MEVHRNAAPVQPQRVLQSGGKEAGSVRPPPGGHQHGVGLGRLRLALGRKGARQRLALPLHPLYDGAGVDPDPPLFQQHGQVLTQLPVQRGQDAVHGLDDGDLGAQGAAQAGKLHADDPAADDGQPGIEPPVGQQLVAGDHAGQVQPRHRRLCGNCARGDEDVPALQHLFPHPDLSRLLHPGGAPEKLHLVALQQALHTGAELTGDLVLPGGHGPVVEAHALRL